MEDGRIGDGRGTDATKSRVNGLRLHVMGHDVAVDTDTGPST